MPHNRVKRYLFVQCTCCLICLYWKLYGFEISQQKLVKQFIAWWWNNLATQPFHIGSTTHFESIIIIFIMNNILVKKEWENNAFTVLIIELYSQHSFILIKFSFFCWKFWRCKACWTTYIRQFMEKIMYKQNF